MNSRKRWEAEQREAAAAEERPVLRYPRCWTRVFAACAGTFRLSAATWLLPEHRRASYFGADRQNDAVPLRSHGVEVRPVEIQHHASLGRALCAGRCGHGVHRCR